MSEVVIKIATEFSKTPGPRKETEAKDSGETFLKTLLRPRFEEAVRSGMKLKVDLDGAAGYPTSFLEEAFGGLAREFDEALVQNTILFTCDDEPYLEEEIRGYIQEARAKR